MIPTPRPQAVGRAYPVGARIPTDDGDAFAAVIVAWALAALCSGCAVAALARARMLRFADFLPFPVTFVDGAGILLKKGRGDAVAATRIVRGEARGLVR